MNSKLFYVVMTIFLISAASIAQQKNKGLQKISVNSLPVGHQLYKQLKNEDKQNRPQNGNLKEFPKIADRAAERLYYEFDKTCNPNTRKIPEGIFEKEMIFSKSQKSLSYDETQSKSSKNLWRPRGPFNVGGRTRALAIDLKNENIILAGGVSGGMWRSENQGKTWRKVTRRFQHQNITAIAQDPRPNHRNIWYYGGGGERIGNSASAVGAPYLGVGIYKSSDGGRTWELLSSTFDNSIVENSPFDEVNRIVVDPTTGDVYVATNNGIHRSKNGGITFEEVLPSLNGNATEIAVTSQGRFYVSVDGNNNNDDSTNTSFQGILTSEDGENWTNISVLEDVYNEEDAFRAVFAINPSNENEIYVFSANLDSFTGVTPGLYRYRRDVPENRWTDLSDKLPPFITPVQGIDLQFSYNMVIAVHPTNPDLILVGGTNIYRTTDGFRTEIVPEQNNWIGGYSPLNNISLYPDQHPDQHAFVFFPSNPNRVLNANDGGVYITNDITANNSFEEPVDWISLNNGYLTTQPYAVSLNPQSTTQNEILAGFQDNSTWFTDKRGLRAPWTDQFSGDGTYNAIADNGRTRYVSAQRGVVARLDIDENGDQVSFARVDPSGTPGFSFVTPFILDPINDNVMYIPASRVIYRNSNTDEIPKNSLSQTRVNWRELTSTEVPSIREAESGRELNTITALDISRFPQPDVLYYGTGQGQLYRLDFASLPSSTPVDIFTGKGLPENANVSSIQVDPSDHQRVVVAFSNYETRSIFFTPNGGKKWIDISGNLEENRDGTGNGPSVRWVSFLGNKDGLLAATSSGVYRTRELSGKNTVWRLSSRRIGNAVVEQIRTRKDGFTIAGVHGNGVFSKKFKVKSQPENTLFVNEQIENIIGLPTETTDRIEVNIENVFKTTNNVPVETYVENLTVDKDFVNVRIARNRKKLIIDFKKFPLNIPEHEKEGIARIRLLGVSFGQRLAIEFAVTTSQTPIFFQLDPSRGVFTVNSLAAIVEEEDPVFGGMFELEPADDFIVPSGETWDLSRIQLFGNRFINVEDVEVGNKVRLRIYSDDNGQPGEVLHDLNEIELINDPETQIVVMDILVPETAPIKLTEGTYWFSMLSLDVGVFSNNFLVGQQIYRENETFDTNPAAYREGEVANFVIFADELGPWVPLGDIFFTDDSQSQLVFSFFGTVTDENNVKQFDNAISNSIVAYPNPVKKDVIFNMNQIESKNQIVSIKILDVSGKIIYESTNIENDFRWNAESVAPGVYFAKIKGISGGKSIDKTIKLIKN